MDDPTIADLHRELRANSSDTKEILRVLRGPFENPEQGLVSKVNRLEQTHKSVRRAMAAAVIGALGAVGTAIGSLVHFGSSK